MELLESTLVSDEEPRQRLDSRSARAGKAGRSACQLLGMALARLELCDGAPGGPKQALPIAGKSEGSKINLSGGAPEDRLLGQHARGFPTIQ
jgi:hypothetical protein